VVKFEELHNRMNTVNYLNNEIRNMEGMLKRKEIEAVEYGFIQHAIGCAKVCLGDKLKQLLLDEVLEFLSISIVSDSKEFKVELRYDDSTKCWCATCQKIPAMLVVGYNWLEVQERINKYFENRAEKGV